jgi:thiol-disulfide isomerase/thioredoxin
MDTFLRDVDLFKRIPSDLVQTSSRGQLLTLICYVVVAIVVACECWSFMKTTYSTEVTINSLHNASMTVDFDVTMHELPCEHAKVVVKDAFGRESVQSRERLHYVDIAPNGEFSGKVYNQDEIKVFDEDTKELTEEEHAALDSDWLSSSDKFKHDNFNKVVGHHDFSMLLFYADWCSHCRSFHPTWKQAADRISDKWKFTDQDGKTRKVHFLKMNCQDFSDTCKEQNIRAYPQMRLYKKDGTFQDFDRHRNIEDITAFITDNIKKSHLVTTTGATSTSSGCQIQGELDIPRVPGNFHIMADGRGNVVLNPTMTNVSHTVNKFSFQQPKPLSGGLGSSLFSVLPGELTRWQKRTFPDLVANIAPIDGRTFTTTKEHQAPQHYINVVTTEVPGKTVFYQMTHTNRIANVPKDAEGKDQVPQAKWAFEISPMRVVLTENSKRWFEFVTSMFGLMGGLYTAFHLLNRGAETVITVAGKIMKSE